MTKKEEHSSALIVIKGNPNAVRLTHTKEGVQIFCDYAAGVTDVEVQYDNEPRESEEVDVPVHESGVRELARETVPVDEVEEPVKIPSGEVREPVQTTEPVQKKKGK